MGKAAFLYSEAALFNTSYFWSSEPRNNMLQRPLAVALKIHFPISYSTMFISLILLSGTHRRILMTISGVQVLGSGAVKSDCPEDEEHA